ncbi:MAG: DUF4331 domain-containing protein [Pseudomonadota bacterium]
MHKTFVIIACCTLGMASTALASSHREAPAITETPKVDATDFYLFRSYEPGREDFVTLVANYAPLQDAYGGPNYFTLDDAAVYDLHIDNDGDAREDLTFRFRFTTEIQDISLQIGDGAGETVAVPIITTVPGGVGPGRLDRNGLNAIESYTLEIIRGDRRNQGATVTNADGGAMPTRFLKPVDNIGFKSIPDYAAYADAHIYNISIPGCGLGRAFVGQRQDPFPVNLGEVFDLINTDPVGPRDAEANDLDDKNVTALVLELPTSCLSNGSDPVIGGWTTASLPQATIRNRAPQFDTATGSTNATVSGGALTQVSRLGNPLVNEVVIGLRDKDAFNASEPFDDPQFLTYVTHPALPELIEALFGGAGVAAPNNFPRNDLVTVFLTGIPGLTQPANLTAPGEMLRLNTEVAITPSEAQSNLGVIGGDAAGFPNGRRPGDDVVDIALRTVMGVLCTLDDPATFGCAPGDAPSGDLPYTDGAALDAGDFAQAFPYLAPPLAGSPNSGSGG